MHFYQIFGLKIQSEFKFPFVTEKSVTNTNINIKFGKVPEQIISPLNTGVLFQSNDSEFIFHIKDKCRYMVRKGNEIIIEKTGNVNDKDIYTFLAGSVFGALFQQRGQIAVHACSVEKNNKSVLLMGHTGIGKSTIALHMYNLGYHIISDDISVISKNKSIEYGTPYIKIWYNVLKKKGLFRSELETLRDGIQKYIYPIKLYKQHNAIEAIFFIKENNNKSFKVKELSGTKKFDMMLRNLYKPQFARKTKFEKETFKALSDLTSSVPIYLLERGRDRDYQEDIEKEVIKFLD